MKYCFTNVNYACGELVFTAVAESGNFQEGDFIMKTKIGTPPTHVLPVKMIRGFESAC